MTTDAESSISDLIVPSETTISKHRRETDILSDIEKLSASPGYVHALAFMCWQSNYFGYDNELTPDDLSEMKSHDRIIRSELSLLTGLMIKSPIDIQHPTESAIQHYIETSEKFLEELHNAMNFRAFTDVKRADFDSTMLSRGMAMREPFFYSGEAAYMFQYRDFSTEKYRNDARWLTNNKGFTLDHVRKVINAINELQVKKLGDIRLNTTTENIADLTLLPAFIFTSEEISKNADCAEEVVNNILSAFSPQSIPCNATLTEIGAFNEANSYPAIPIDDGKFILLQGYSLAESAYETPFFWMLQDKNYAEKAKENRGLFTESFSTGRLRAVLGNNRVFENVFILDSKGQRAGEIDVLAVYADRAIILQAKSKKLTEAARKGNDEAIRSDFKKAIDDAYQQGFKCAKLLNDPLYKLADEKGRAINIRKDFSEIFIFCVVSEFYPALSHQADYFLEVHDHKVIQRPYVMDVFFLDVLCEILDTPLQFFNFLHRRSGYYKKIKSESELAVLSYHLTYNLWFKEDIDLVHLGDDFSVHVDSAMLVRREGLPGKRTPEGLLTKLNGYFFNNIIKTICSMEADNVLELGYFLLEMNEDSAKDLSKACEIILDRTKKDGLSHDITMAFGEKGITVHANPGWGSDVFDKLHAHCAARKYSQKAETWFGLLLNPNCDGFIAMAMGLNSPWEQSDEMENFLKQLPPPSMRHRNLTQALRQSTIAKNRIGVNATCPCGSGKKYKKCCLTRR